MAEKTTISNAIFGKCATAYGLDASKCDGITGLTIEPTLVTDLASIYKNASDQWRLIGALIESDFTGKSCGVRKNGMWDIIQATRKQLDGRKIGAQAINSGLWELMPFVKMERKNVINREYWTFASGEASATNDPPGSTWKGTVTSQGSLPASGRWFPAGLRVFISGVTVAGVKTLTQYEVTGTANVSGSSCTVYLKSLNGGPILPGGAIHTDPTGGLLVRGTPNKSDYEKFCAIIPGVNATQLVPFWLETTRYSIPWCEKMAEYIKLIKANNPYFRKFGDIEEAELTRQLTEDFQARDAWAFWFNKPLANQTMSTWDQLEQIQGVAGDYLPNPYSGRVLARRASATGIYWQHQECGQVKDLLAQTLNIQELLPALYKLKRVREDNGLESKYIEAWMPSDYADKFEQALIKLQDVRTNGLTRVVYNVSDKSEQGAFGTVYRTFELSYPRVQLRIVTHKFLDDVLEAHVTAGVANGGRFVWFPDFSVNYRASVVTNTVTNKSGTLQDLAKVDPSYLCVMKVNSDQQKLFSFTGTNVSECPQSSLFLENVGPDVPEWRGVDSAPGDLYGTYAG